jgi:hypothetical protein
MSPVLGIVLATLTGILVFGCIRPAILCIFTAATLDDLLHGPNKLSDRTRD